MIPKSWRRLEVPVPPNLERAMGYEGAARFVGFNWTPAGDEADFDDGQWSGTGHWDAFLAFVQHPKVHAKLSLLPRLNLGSSDEEAEHMLVLDRQEPRGVYVGPVGLARRFLQEQHPPLQPDQLLERGAEVAETLEDFMDLSKWSCREVPQEEIEEAVRRRQDALEAIVRYLDESEA